jgi:hypothetical protein
MAAMATSELEEARRREREDWLDRITRNDPDWDLYEPGQPRRHLPWWRRVLKV